MRQGVLTVSLLLAMAASAQAFMSGDSIAGKVLSDARCAACHESAGTADTPTFLAIADDQTRYTLGRIREGVERPHWPDRTLVLSSKDSDNLVAYLLSIRNR